MLNQKLQPSKENYSALDVAGFIVHYCNHTLGKHITHIHLQKILYFLEGHYLVKNKELFKDDISKWKLGPVVESVYHEYKTFGSGSITHVPNRLIFENGMISFEKFNPQSIDKTDQLTIQELLNKFIKCDPFYLVDETHRHIPWKKDEEKINTGIKGLKYTKEEIKHYFLDNPQDLEVI